MPLQDVWRTAIEAIGDGNDAATGAQVRAERDAIVAAWRAGKQTLDFSSDLQETLLGGHQLANVEMLRDYVTYLIWVKLAQRQGENAPDQFLGLADLGAYLEARAPEPYSAADVAAFLTSLGPPLPLGDLRAYLCARAGVGIQLYTHAQLDQHLLWEEVENLRRHPPGNVTAGFRGAELAQQLRAFRNRSDHDLLALLDRGIPMSIFGMAHIITLQLIVGSCDCPENYSTRSEATNRAYLAAEVRCRETHFLSHDNLEAALAGIQTQQRQAVAGPLEFVERAVIERLHLPLEKTFANTMLANIFVTPRGGRLRRKLWWNGHHEVEVLTETGRDLAMGEDAPTAIPEDEPQEFPCFGCPDCGSFIPGRGSYGRCIEACHGWLYGTVSQFGSPELRLDEVMGGYVEVIVSVCQARHVWPGDVPRCPWCDRLPIQSKKKVLVYCPTNRGFEDVDWSDHLP